MIDDQWLALLLSNVSDPNKCLGVLKNHGLLERDHDCINFPIDAWNGVDTIVVDSAAIFEARTHAAIYSYYCSRAGLASEDQPHGS